MARLSDANRATLIALLQLWEPRNGWQRILKGMVIAALSRE